MRAQLLSPLRVDSSELLIEGYASLFGVEDLSGDVVRAGAFGSVTEDRALPMLLQHRPGAQIGQWVRLQEDGRGLFVRGLINQKSAACLVRNGLDGLSIGFRPLVWSLRPSGGRLLSKIELVEVSLVANPMLPSARFEVVSGSD
ncbi:MAG: HK97 family phage prohead protease [Pseudomonadota bacterium]